MAISTPHASYYRRKYDSERAFRVCNLRKSKGLYLAAQGADPIPNVSDCTSPYRVKIVKYQNRVRFYVNDLQLFEYTDDGQTHGGLLGAGRIGFRQMSPMIAEYADLQVYALSQDEKEM